MGIESWLFLVSVLCSLVAIFAVIMVVKQGQNSYGNGYAQGYQNGANEKYNEVYKKRLLRQAQRATAREKKHEPTNTEEFDRGVQGRVESISGEPGSQSISLFEHDADAGAGTESSDE